ncbi:MAG: DUF3598 family protein [Cyanobacterium sp. T60_A2020_053]|nr:DUF3598 family protein [Cyanobacterium sp. T60_A2020_053]
MSSSQWLRLLKNVGIWQGSFTQFSPQGELRKNTPTEITLEGLNDNQAMRLTVNRVEEDTPPHVNEFTYLNRSIFLFEEGHFSKGSLQFSPFATFGAEFGFFLDNRRLRMVQLFDKNSDFEGVTLIREFRKDTPRFEKPPLTVEQLRGEWQGRALTLYPDWRPSPFYDTKLLITQEGNRLIQTLQTPFFNLSSQGVINGNTITFDDTNNRLLLLPDGASSCNPMKITHRQPFFLESAWLVEPDLRLRLIRNYEATGAWESVTLVTEKRIG